jgi:hypothetical protein
VRRHRTRIMVTGPSLTSSTRIIAPNTPLFTWTLCERPKQDHHDQFTVNQRVPMVQRMNGGKRTGVYFGF